MIKIDKVYTYGFAPTVRGMRNPLNSWDKSDSSNEGGVFVIGEKDLELFKRLVNSGNDHGKALRMIQLWCDILAPLYWWKEFDTYKVGTTANSCSTMHKIAAKEFELDDFSTDHLSDRSIAALGSSIMCMNYYRELYLETKKKDDWWQMIQLLPTSYNQLRTVNLNYAVLRNMYHARKEHKLDEWRVFCKWVETLPYSELITED